MQNEATAIQGIGCWVLGSVTEDPFTLTDGTESLPT